jgi:uncharacterized RDD family membrane protein YckC
MTTVGRGTPDDQAARAGSAHEPAAAWMPPDAEATAQRIGAEPASWWRRVGATLLDGLLVIVLFFAFAIVLSIAAGSVDARAARLGWGLVGLLYAILMLAYHGGQTVGKEVARVRVVAEDGSPVGAGRATARELTKAVFVSAFVLPYVLDVLWPLWQPENRALHDLIAGTRVVQAERRPPNGYYPAHSA